LLRVKVLFLSNFHRFRLSFKLKFTVKTPSASPQSELDKTHADVSSLNSSGHSSSPTPLPQYAEVAIPLRVAQTFTYRLPLALRAEARTGSRLLVPLNSKLQSAYIVALHTELDAGLEIDEAEIKDAEELLDAEPLLTPEVLELTKWIADYYAAPWGEVLKAALPAGLNQTIERVLTVTSEGRDELARLHAATDARAAARLNTLSARALRFISDEGETTMRAMNAVFGKSAQATVRKLERAGWVKIAHRARSASTRAKRRKAVRLLPPEAHKTDKRALTEAQHRVIENLINVGGETDFTTLLEASNTSASVVGTLERRGMIEIFARDVRRDPLAGVELPRYQDFVLTEQQTKAFDEIERALKDETYKAFLLHGVTGSGKTEIYIRAMRACIERGQSAMMLVPEISLTPVFSRRLRSVFGDRVAIFHSSLSPGERFDEWTRLRRGEARVVIGTRSAVFAPVSALGIVIIDEEHEASYRQQESPFYSARDAGVMRALKENAVVVLGSATPSLESFYNAERGKYVYLRLPERIGGAGMAEAEIVDMRGVLNIVGRQEVFSDELLKAIAETHERGEQSIILLNRRGYSSFVLCRSCGERMGCPNCDVTLTYHQSAKNLICHYCDYRQRVPSACPLCKGQYIYFIGEGTEQIEEILGKKFPGLRIARLDRDTTARRHTYERTIMRFAAGEIDMLVGTQMIAKGHDFPNVTLVGVVSADAGLALPDFRAAERSFQLITQVAGRAGRGALAGRVLIQSYHPEHYALRHAARQDYSGFYKEEIRYRKSLQYPPFVVLASLLVHGEDYTEVQTIAAEIKNAIDNVNTDRACRILGPAPAPIARLRGRHRIQILVKAKSRTRLREILDIALAEVVERGCNLRNVNLEIDPVNLM
jgi:primosomal protein N' (replication factor Y) (superfamily II helicase)